MLGAVFKQFIEKVIVKLTYSEICQIKWEQFLDDFILCWEENNVHKHNIENMENENSFVTYEWWW